jgi:hypothetical protein
MQRALFSLFLALVFASCNTKTPNTNVATNHPTDTLTPSVSSSVVPTADVAQNQYDTTLTTYHYVEKKFDEECDHIVIRYFDILLPQTTTAALKDTLFHIIFSGDDWCETYKDSLRILPPSEAMSHHYFGFAPYCDEEDFYLYRCGRPIWVGEEFMCYTTTFGGYLGGAHGYMNEIYFVFELNTGRCLTSADMFDQSKTAELSALISDRMLENAEESDCFWDGFEPHMENVRFEPHAITFVYPPYEAACYAQGHVEVTFTVAEILPYLNEKFTIYKEFKAK